MKWLMVLVSAITGCSSVRDSTPGDAQKVSDARSAGSDGGVSAGACKSHMTVAVAPNGARFESTSFFVVRSDIHPGDDFTIVACDYVQIPAPATGGCPAGYTCTDSGEALPAGRTCTTARGTSMFIGDALYFSCGYESRNLDTQGTETSHAGGYYMSVTITR